MANSTRLSLLVLCCLAIGLSGCNKTEAVTHYTVKKPVPIRPAADPHAGLGIGNPQAPPDSPPTGPPTDRTLGAIIPQGTQGWFFKLTGQKDPVESRLDEFMALVKSVKFAPDGKPRWTLPSGWQERPGNDIRFATLVTNDQPPLEVSVTVLPHSGDATGFLLANINRWRSQLRMSPITVEQLPAEVQEFPLDGTTATVVNLVGHAAPGGMGGAPFMQGARP